MLAGPGCWVLVVLVVLELRLVVVLVALAPWTYCLAPTTSGVSAALQFYLILIRRKVQGSGPSNGPLIYAQYSTLYHILCSIHVWNVSCKVHKGSLRICLGPASEVKGKSSIQPEISHICVNFVIRNVWKELIYTHRHWVHTYFTQTSGINKLLDHRFFHYHEDSVRIKQNKQGYTLGS